jgi:hypothetical protein
MQEGKRFVGLDVGKRTYEAAVIGAGGKVTRGNGKTTLEGRVKLYAKLRKEDKVVLEAGNLAFIMAKEIGRQSPAKPARLRGACAEHLRSRADL